MAFCGRSVEVAASISPVDALLAWEGSFTMMATLAGLQQGRAWGWAARAV